MGLILKTLIIIAQFGKTLCPFLALLYMICWGFLIGNPELFEQWNSYLGAFPDFLNEKFQFQSDIDGRDIDMGYVLAAAFSFVLMFILNQLQNFVEYRLLLYREQVVEKTKEELKIKKIVEQMEEKKDEFVVLKSFWGLLEVEITKNDIYDNNLNLEEVKEQYIKTIFAKLKDNYPNLKILQGKLCLVLTDFLMFKNSIKDIVKLIKLLKEIALKKGLRLDYMLSYFATDNQEQNKKAFVTLNKINNLKMKNKVVVSKDIRNFCFKKNTFKFNALGSSLLFAQGADDEDIEIELHQVISLD